MAKKEIEKSISAIKEHIEIIEKNLNMLKYGRPNNKNEKKILDMIKKGTDYRKIAKECGVSEKTVYNVYHKNNKA